MKLLRDDHFRRRFLLRNIAVATPLLLVFALLWINRLNVGVTLVVGVAVFAAGILLWAWRDRRLLRSYHCPKCKAHLRTATVQERKEGDPICFYCAACDVEWDTTLRQ